jgi:RHS repeat-associated protein
MNYSTPHYLSATSSDGSFGMGMEGRKWSGASDYRYGFNGMENDNEVYGERNAIDFGARIYDSRLGRWLSRDPLEFKYPGISTYAYAFNSPIVFNDPSGKGGVITVVDEGNVHTVTLETTVWLIGKDAEQYKDSPTFTNKTVKVEDPQIKDKIWDVQIIVHYKYSPEMNNYVESEGLKEGVYMDDLPTETENKISKGIEAYGFQAGDNVLQLDDQLRQRGTGTGGTFGTGNWYAFAREFISENGVIQNMRHEPGHQIGFDERYDPFVGLQLGHLSFDLDYMGRGSATLISSEIMDFSEIHYVDLLDFAIPMVGANKSQVFDNRNDLNTLHLDSTNSGRDPESTESITDKKNRIKR